MERLEKYLNWVCGRIGGAKDMRAHVRQELHEHLLDAAAEHEAAGMSKEEAMKKALDDFGVPEEVRDELEQTHGARLSAIVLEKALNWKEQTMKAKWLWKTWLQVMMAALILLELVFVWGAQIFLVPKYNEMFKDGLLGLKGMPGVEFDNWAINFLMSMRTCAENGIWILITVAVAWALFEWRVRSENKGLMRLGAQGTIAVVLMVLVMLTGIALAVPPMMRMPGVAMRPQELVRQAREDFEKAVPLVEEAAAKKDWETLEAQAQEGRFAAQHLVVLWAAEPLMFSATDEKRVHDIRENLREVAKSLSGVGNAARDHDEKGVEEQMTKFHAAYAQMLEAEKGTVSH